MATKCADTVTLSPQEAAARLEHVVSPIAAALRLWLMAQPGGGGKRSLPLFEVKYRYGQGVFGPREGAGKFSKVLAPCSAKAGCKHCQHLMEVLSNHRPLTIVLDGSCEEYLEYEQSPAPTMRCAPLRFHSKGDTIGITRLLNQLYQPAKPVRSIFGRSVSSARRLVSGARSIFFTTSIKNPQISEYLLQHVSPEILEKHLGQEIQIPKSLSPGIVRILATGLKARFENDHWTFFKILADAAVASGLSAPWQCRILFVPVEPLAALLKTPGKSEAARDLLLAVLSEYFLFSRNTRSESLRQMVVDDRLSGSNLSPYEASTIQHLIEMIRGEFPGFRPHDPNAGDDFGPYNAVQQYLHEAGLTRLEFSKAFPGIVRPVQFDPAKHGFFYYSFERPTVIAPIGKKGAGRKFPAHINSGLELLREQRPDLFDSMKWQFFLSKGKPVGPPHTPKSKLERVNIQSARYQSLLDDFQPLISHAGERGWLSGGIRQLEEEKWGFMAGFIRISASSADATASRKGTSDAD